MELVNSNQMSLGAAYKSSTSILSPMGWERTGLSFGCRFFQLLGMAPPSVLIVRCAPRALLQCVFQPARSMVLVQQVGKCLKEVK